MTTPRRPLVAALLGVIAVLSMTACGDEVAGPPPFRNPAGPSLATLKAAALDDARAWLSGTAEGIGKDWDYMSAQCKADSDSSRAEFIDDVQEYVHQYGLDTKLTVRGITARLDGATAGVVNFDYTTGDIPQDDLEDVAFDFVDQQWVFEDRSWHYSGCTDPDDATTA